MGEGVWIVGILRYSKKEFGDNKIGLYRDNGLSCF